MRRAAPSLRPGGKLDREFRTAAARLRNNQFVNVLEDDGRKTTSRTRSEPWVLGDGVTRVILLEGRVGGFDVRRVTPGVEVVTVADFHARIKAQGVEKVDLAFRCPICATIQSAADFIAAGAAKTFEDAEKFLAFSCVGRFTGAGSYRPGEAPGRGCDWTLGGLFQIHTFGVSDEGKTFPRFEPVTAEEAREHRDRARAVA